MPVLKNTGAQERTGYSFGGHSFCGERKSFVITTEGLAINR